MVQRIPSPNSSIANAPDDSGKLHSPSAARNTADLCKAIQSIAPPQGRALEIASGTGQHIVAFAKAMPNIKWFPTDTDMSRLGSIDAHSTDSGLSNISPPFLLDATVRGWSQNMPNTDLIVVANLLHLISEDETETLINEAVKALALKGQLVFYGPFKRDGALTSTGDLTFDAELRAHDPEIGYKDTAWITAQAKRHSFRHLQTIEMPANNLALVLKR